MCNSEVVTIDPEEVLQEMKKFIFYLAHKNEDDLIGMEFDDIVQELSIELIKGTKYYSDKNLNPEQLKAVLRRILDNRISELRYKYYVTYRKSFRVQIRIDIDLDQDAGMSDPERVILSKGLIEKTDLCERCESEDRVCATRNMLSDISKRVFDAIVMSDDASIREMHNTNVEKHLKYQKVADALNIQENVVRTAFSEIRNAYKIVCEEMEEAYAVR